MKRFIYTLRQVCRHRHALKQARVRGVPHVLSLDLGRLKKSNIKCLVLDFDGVLAPHGDKMPLPEVMCWLENIIARNDFQLAILSNKPTSSRQQFFTQYMPSIHFVSGTRKKPYPDGLLALAQQLQLAPDQLLMVDDRLLTGCLSAVGSGAKPLWIRRPYVRFLSKKLLIELFFSFLRMLDRLICF